MCVCVLGTSVFRAVFEAEFSDDSAGSAALSVSSPAAATA